MVLEAIESLFKKNPKKGQPDDPNVIKRLEEVAEPKEPSNMTPNEVREAFKNKEEPNPPPPPESPFTQAAKAGKLPPKVIGGSTVKK